MLNKLLPVIGSLIVLIGTVFGIYFYFEARYALAEELKKTQQRLEQKIVGDRANQIQDRIWKLQDRMEERKPTASEKEELRVLQYEKELLDKAIKEGK